MKIVVFKGGLGNQLFQYAFYKYLSRKDETFYFYNDAWYNVSHNGFELDKYFKTDDLKKCSRFWIILFKTILSKLYHWKIYVVGSVEYQYPNHLFQAGYFLDKNRHKAQRKAKFYINKCRSVSCMQGELKQASA